MPKPLAVDTPASSHKTPRASLMCARVRLLCGHALLGPRPRVRRPLGDKLAHINWREDPDRTLFFSILPQKIWVPTEKPTFRTFSWTRPLIGRIPGLQRPCGNLMEAPRHRKWACRASALGLSAMFTRTTVGCALVGYAGAFSGMSPLALKPTSASTSALRLRAAGPSMKIGVFFGTSTGNTESVATRVS